MRGFSLIEIIITTALLSLLVGMGLFMSMEAYRGATRRSERDVIVAMLEKARSRSMANIDQSSWSVCYDAGDYVIARGDDCPNDEHDRVEASAAVIADPGTNISELENPDMILFQQLSGNVLAAISDELEIVVNQTGKEEEITINYEGRINW